MISFNSSILSKMLFLSALSTSGGGHQTPTATNDFPGSNAGNNLREHFFGLLRQQ